MDRTVRFALLSGKFVSHSLCFMVQQHGDARISGEQGLFNMKSEIAAISSHGRTHIFREGIFALSVPGTIFVSHGRRSDSASCLSITDPASMVLGCYPNYGPQEISLRLWLPVFLVRPCSGAGCQQALADSVFYTFFDAKYNLPFILNRRPLIDLGTAQLGDVRPSPRNYDQDGLNKTPS